MTLDNGWDLLTGLAGILNNEEYGKRSRAVLGNAFTKVLLEIRARKLTWMRTSPAGLSGDPSIETVTTVEDSNGEPHQISVLLFVRDDHLYLRLGRVNGPSLDAWLNSCEGKAPERPRRILLAFARETFGGKEFKHGAAMDPGFSWGFEDLN